MSDVGDTAADQTATAIAPGQTEGAAGQRATDASSIFRDPSERELQTFEAARPVPQQAASRSGAASVDELARFLVGILTWSGDELLQRIHEIQEDLDANPQIIEHGQRLDQESTVALLRYLTIGLLMRGQRRAVEGARQGFYFSLGAASWWADKVKRWSDNRFMRPIRRPIASRMQTWGNKASRIIREGRREEQQGRVLATETIQEIIDDVIDLLADNPELNQTIQELVGKQSVGIASVISDNARSVTVVADGITESVVRRVLGRTPRSELPPSPLRGRTQTMYKAPDPVEEAEKRGS